MLAPRERKVSLSRRQIEVLQFLADGNLQKNASSIGIAHSTLKTHLSAVYAKLGARCLPQAIAIALRNGWIE